MAGTVDVIRKLTCVKQRVQRNRLLFHEFSRDDARSLCSEKLNTPTAAHGTERLIHDRLIAFALSHWLVAFSDCWPCPPNRAFRLTPSLLAALFCYYHNKIQGWRPTRATTKRSMHSCDQAFTRRCLFKIRRALQHS